MDEGKMTDQDRARLDEWQETEAALDEIEQGAAWQAMFRAEELRLDPLAHALAGEVADAHEHGMTENQFWANPNVAIQHTLTKMHINPDDTPAHLATVADILKAHGLWPWD